MGHRAFIARSGWSKTPISADEWREAVATLPELELYRGTSGTARAMLRGSRRRGVVLQQGYLCGEYVDSRLIAVMFVLADRLGAQVYSEHRHAYRDVADWRERSQRRGPGRQQRPDAARGRGTAPPSLSTAYQHAVASWSPFLVGGILTVLLALWALQ